MNLPASLTDVKASLAERLGWRENIGVECQPLRLTGAGGGCSAA